MILEGIVTTIGPDGSPHIAAMGPVVDRHVTRIRLRPFQTSQTFRNLKSHGEGVFHVTDDVLLLARSVIGAVDPLPPMVPADRVTGYVLRDACRCYEFRVTSIDDRRERAEIETEVVEARRLRDFFGFNRAKHAVVEAAILASRIHLLPAEEIETEFRRLAVLVEKTGGDQEQRAFALLEQAVRDAREATQP